jgi:hypothetical protein
MHVINSNHSLLNSQMTWTVYYYSNWMSVPFHDQIGSHDSQGSCLIAWVSDYVYTNV